MRMLMGQETVRVRSASPQASAISSANFINIYSPGLLCAPHGGPGQEISQELGQAPFETDFQGRDREIFKGKFDGCIACID
jgi:hypothetical protein